MKTKIPKNERKKATIAMSQEFAAKLRVIATHRDILMPEALDKYGGPGIDREFRKVLEELNQELNAE